MIYCVEDERNIRELLVYTLETTGFEAIGIQEGKELFRCLEKELPDFILLHIMLPGQDGYSILEKLKKEPKTRDIPVIMVTAKEAEYDKVRGLDSGADDYITKPFSIIVLHKIIEALLRRGVKVSENKKWFYGDIEIDFEGYSARKNGENIDLKPKEIKLIELLLKYEGKVLTRAQILDNLWSIEESPNDRVIDVYIKNIRKKIILPYIKTVIGIGYTLQKDI